LARHQNQNGARGMLLALDTAARPTDLDVDKVGSKGGVVEGEVPVPGAAALVVVAHHPHQPLHIGLDDGAAVNLRSKLVLVVAVAPALRPQLDLKCNGQSESAAATVPAKHRLCAAIVTSPPYIVLVLGHNRVLPHLLLQGGVKGLTHQAPISPLDYRYQQLCMALTSPALTSTSTPSSSSPVRATMINLRPASDSQTAKHARNRKHVSNQATWEYSARRAQQVSIQRTTPMVRLYVPLPVGVSAL